MDRFERTRTAWRTNGELGATTSTFDPRLDLMVERVVRVSAGDGVGGMDRARSPAPVVRAGAGRDLGMRDRPAPGRSVPVRAPSARRRREPLRPVAISKSCRFAGWCGPTRCVPATGRRRRGFFTAVMTLEPHGDATLCTAVAMHRNEADRNHHAEMGFHDGWGTVLDQLGAYAPTDATTERCTHAQRCPPPIALSRRRRRGAQRLVLRRRPRAVRPHRRGARDRRTTCSWVAAPTTTGSTTGPPSDVEPFATFINATPSTLRLRRTSTGHWKQHGPDPRRRSPTTSAT